jgi:hypothetical protein
MLHGGRAGHQAKPERSNGFSILTSALIVRVPQVDGAAAGTAIGTVSKPNMVAAIINRFNTADRATLCALANPSALHLRLTAFNARRTAMLFITGNISAGPARAPRGRCARAWTHCRFRDQMEHTAMSFSRKHRLVVQFARVSALAILLASRATAQEIPALRDRQPRRLDDIGHSSNWPL